MPPITTPYRMLRALPALIAACALLACSGGEGPPGSAGPNSPGGGSGGSTAGPDYDPASDPWQPLTACEPVLDQRVTRLSDHHIANSVAELLAIQAPQIETGALSEHAFIPGKAATVNGAVASKLQDVAEAAAAEAVVAGSKAVSCAGVEDQCARTFIDEFAGRAFRRLLTDQERTELFAVYTVGRNTDESHAGGISLVAETVLQSPSFLYLAEVGTPDGAGFRLTSYELAAKLSFFLRDSLPDASLWQAAQSGKLDTDAGLATEVDRLLADASVQSNLTGMFSRFFQLDAIPDLMRAEEPNWPALSTAMHQEVTQFVSEVLWKKTGKLSELLTSREASVSPELATFYGVTPPAGQSPATITLPLDQRAGILTRAGFMAVNADEHQTSVVFRGLQVARGLLCVEPPPPPPSIAAQIEALKAEMLTERERTMKRLENPTCAGCHGFFDGFGVMFENYDSLGRYRTTLETQNGEQPVDASWQVKLADVEGMLQNGVQLSERLGESKAARECMSRQIASYAIGEKLSYEQACTVGALSQRFEATGGDLKSLIREVALWPALRTRRAVVAP